MQALSSEAQAEAARYALLRRLAPSMRHHLVVNLQPIGMIYEVMDRRLRAPQPDLAGVYDSAHKINGFARAALNSCVDVVTWLAPEEEMLTTAVAGVAECTGLITTSLTFRGFALRNEVEPVPGDVRRSAMRNVLTAALLCATDEARPPAELVLSARQTPEFLVLMLLVRPTQGEQGFPTEPTYRKLDWFDVQALAAAESVELAREGNQSMRLAIPWAKKSPADRAAAAGA